MLAWGEPRGELPTPDPLDPWLEGGVGFGTLHIAPLMSTACACAHILISAAI